MSKVLNIRLDDRDFEAIERRDRERYPSQSDYVRAALRRLRLEERRNLTRREAKKLAQEPDDVALQRAMADARADAFAERWEKADRGEL